MKTHAFRLEYGMDLNTEIEGYVKKNNIKAGVILSGVGCVYAARVRSADGITIKDLNGNYEIVSLMGTLSQDGCHLHVSFSDNNLNTYGGHLLDGCLINTTAEIVLLELDHITFARNFDKKTGYDELICINS